MNGKIHSIESFGTVDGPGIRFVVFMQGCPMRCKYCHNPDTWNFDGGEVISSEELVEKYMSTRNFHNNGGVTVTGGEPLSQIDFIIDFFEKLKLHGVHTCVDTSGVTFNREKPTLEKFDKLISLTDLFMVDFKHINPLEHKSLTGHSNENIFDFADYLCEKSVPIWARHVVVPTITLNDEYLFELGKRLSKYRNLKAIDVLPYHKMGVSKYDELNLEYPLKGVLEATKEEAVHSKDVIMQGLREGLLRKN